VSAIDPPSRFNPCVDADLDSISLKALGHAPEGRYPSASEFLAALSAWNPKQTADEVGKRAAIGETTKGVLGMFSPVHEGQARSLAARAVDLARQTNQLGEAADLMEQAVNQWPPLRDRYEYQLKLWRRGVSL